ncbi:MAG: hypothetical protein ABI831_16850 [Betaproteobacteria bacterium]
MGPVFTFARDPWAAFFKTRQRKRLFQYEDEAGMRRSIDSDQVNSYLRETMGADFTAKDFRTWGATLRALAILHATPLPEPVSKAALNRCINSAVQRVAKDLRNTPAVCRKSYINPVVFHAWQEGVLHSEIRGDIKRLSRRAERLVLGFLRNYATRGKRAANQQPPLSGLPERSRTLHRRSAPHRRLERPDDKFGQASGNCS